MANADATRSLRIQTEQVLDRGAASARNAGELAGRFAAMLEQLNGVGSETVSAPEGAASSSAVGGPLERRVALGAVSLIAQTTEEPDPATPAGIGGNGAAQVVQETLAGAQPLDVRWLTTLFTQSGEGA